METFELVIDDCSHEVAKTKLDVLLNKGVVKLSPDNSHWVLDEDSENYELALALLTIGDE